jgi:hypothetical protein
MKRKEDPCIFNYKLMNAFPTLKICPLEAVAGEETILKELPTYPFLGFYSWDVTARQRKLQAKMITGGTNLFSVVTNLFWRYPSIHRFYVGYHLSFIISFLSVPYPIECRNFLSSIGSGITFLSFAIFSY